MSQVKSRTPVRAHTKIKSVYTSLQAASACLRHCQEMVRGRWSIYTTSLLLNVINSYHYISYTGRVLQEIQLNESIRYSQGDAVEQWLNDLLCLDVTSVPRILSGCPVPNDCDLYPFCVNLTMKGNAPF